MLINALKIIKKHYGNFILFALRLHNLKTIYIKSIHLFEQFIYKINTCNSTQTYISWKQTIKICSIATSKFKMYGIHVNVIKIRIIGSICICNYTTYNWLCVWGDWNLHDHPRYAANISRWYNTVNNLMIQSMCIVRVHV